MSPALTLAAIAERLDLDRELLELILRDSEHRGLVERDEHGQWGLTPDTEARYGAALRAIGAAASGNGDGGRGIGHGRPGRQKADKRGHALRARVRGVSDLGGLYPVRRADEKPTA